MNGFTQVIGATGPCQHAWSFAPTLSYYQCVNCMERHDHGTPGYEAIAAAQDAMLTTPPASDAAVPAGFVLVPVELTDEQRDAAIAVDIDSVTEYPFRLSADEARAVYRAMIAAAPKVASE